MQDQAPLGPEAGLAIPDAEGIDLHTATQWLHADREQIAACLGLTTAVEVPEPGSPYGLKGVGESPTIVATAAIVGALRAATGRDLNRVPVTPDELVGLAGPARTAGRPPLPRVPGYWPVAFYSDAR
jgi:CO/xanthine dehydrogenase Mo-binding subunit